MSKVHKLVVFLTIFTLTFVASACQSEQSVSSLKNKKFQMLNKDFITIPESDIDNFRDFGGDPTFVGMRPDCKCIMLLEGNSGKAIFEKDGKFSKTKKIPSSSYTVTNNLEIQEIPLKKSYSDLKNKGKSVSSTDITKRYWLSWDDIDNSKYTLTDAVTGNELSFIDKYKLIINKELSNSKKFNSGLNYFTYDDKSNRLYFDNGYDGNGVKVLDLKTGEPIYDKDGKDKTVAISNTDYILIQVNPNNDLVYILSLNRENSRFKLTKIGVYTKDLDPISELNTIDPPIEFLGGSVDGNQFDVFSFTLYQHKAAIAKATFGWGD